MEVPVGFPAMEPGAGTPLFAPAQQSAGNWVGAPCVHDHDDRTYLAVRVRDPRRRGHAIRVYERDGRGSFERVAELCAYELGGASVERPALATDHETGRLKLYVPVDRGANDWRIRKLADVAHPSAFDPATATDVLEPGSDGSDSVTVKDPYVVADGRYYMFYAGHDGDREQAHLAVSDDGEAWERSPANPVLESRGWHDHHTRVSCAVPTGGGWTVFYDGSGREDFGRTWNLRTGVATGKDLATLTDTTTDAPAFAAPTTDDVTNLGRYATCRYLDVLVCEDRWEVFAEVAREDEAFELRHSIVPTRERGT
jgi:hypothetical protein